MAAIHSEFQRYNPCRAPAWRWEYISRLQSHRPRLRPSRFRDDRWVQEAWEFFKQWSRYENNNQRINLLFPTNPGLFYATLLYFNDDPEWRTMMEANLLASLSDERIAEKFGTLPETSFWYERLYFDVRERLKNRCYIHKVIQGKASERAVNSVGSITEFQRALAIKTFAYHGGEHMLNLVTTGFVSNLQAPRRAVDATQWAEDAFNTLMTRQGLVASAVVDINKSNVISILQLVQKMHQQEQHIRMFGSASLEMDRNIAKAGQMITVAMAFNQDLLPAESPKRRRVGPMELRSAEQLQLAAGKKLSPQREQDAAELQERMAHRNRHAR